MSKCQYVKSSGEACKAAANSSSGYCWAHDPDQAERRREIAAKGGKARAIQSTPSGIEASISEVENIQGELREVTEGVLAGRIGSRPGQVAIAGLNARLRAASEHYKLVEEIAFEKRLSEVEERVGGSR